MSLSPSSVEAASQYLVVNLSSQASTELKTVRQEN